MFDDREFRGAYNERPFLVRHRLDRHPLFELDALREMNFLLQIRGSKTVKLWDPHDDEIMSPVDKDQLLADRGEPRPTYKPAFDREAMTFQLAPGLGVHHPFIAPHLVKTGRALSISLAITFRTHRSDVWTDAHRFNHLLRKRLGVAPIPSAASAPSTPPRPASSASAAAPASCSTPTACRCSGCNPTWRPA